MTENDPSYLYVGQAAAVAAAAAEDDEEAGSATTSNVVERQDPVSNAIRERVQDKYEYYYHETDATEYLAWLLNMGFYDLPGFESGREKDKYKLEADDDDDDDDDGYEDADDDNDNDDEDEDEDEFGDDDDDDDDEADDDRVQDLAFVERNEEDYLAWLTRKRNNLRGRKSLSGTRTDLNGIDDGSIDGIDEKSGYFDQVRFRWTDGSVYPALTDFGKPCLRDGDCQSNVCGTSCSSHDVNPMTSHSCECPCTDSDRKKGGIGSFVIGPCCCGCHVNGGTKTSDGLWPVAQVCPQYTVSVTESNSTWARANDRDDPPIENIPCNFTYARFVTLNIADDDISIPPGVEYKVDWYGPSPNGTKEWGDPCDHADECKSGMCGTGCDCPSEVIRTCSCEAPCNWPSKCCAGGCIIDQDPVARICPVPNYDAMASRYNVNYTKVQCDHPYLRDSKYCFYKHRITYTTFDGPTPWMPDDAHNSTADHATYAVCLLYRYTMEGIRLPEVCEWLLRSPPPPNEYFSQESINEALCRSGNGTVVTVATDNTSATAVRDDDSNVTNYAVFQTMGAPIESDQRSVITQNNNGSQLWQSRRVAGTWRNSIVYDRARRFADQIQQCPFTILSDIILYVHILFRIRA